MVESIVADRVSCVKNGIVMLKMVSETPLQFGVAERLSQTFRAESTGVRAEALKMLWADSVSTAYLIYRISYFSIGLRIPEEEWRGKDTSLTHLKVSGCDSFVKVKDVCGEVMKCTFIDSSSLTKPIQKSQVMLVDIPKNLAENDSIVAEHGLSSEITQSPDRSSDWSEGPKTVGASRIVEDKLKNTLKTSILQGGTFQDSTENGEPEYYSEALSSKEFVQ
nr:retrovirus-related Pol polyprotein from transposon TNT 1-94 [Tanacetum cinerariifolium]